MKSILIPVDFSDYGKAACEMGAHLARNTGAELFLLHVAPAPPDWNKIPVEQQQKYPEIESKMVDAEIKLEKLANDKIFNHVKVTGIVRPGVIHEVIQQFSNLYKAELIIMGAHGKDDSEPYFIGSHAQKVLRNSVCPVLSVKKGNRPQLLKKVIFAADYDENLRSALNKITPFIKAMGAKLELLFVNTPSNFKDTETIEAGMKKWVDLYPDLKLRTHIYDAHEIEDGILKLTAKAKGNAIAKVTHNRKGKAGYVLGITETLIYRSKIPVLSITTE